MNICLQTISSLNGQTGLDSRNHTLEICKKGYGSHGDWVITDDTQTAGEYECDGVCTVGNP